MEPKLKLVVLGANGRNGKLVIETALAKGMDVTAVVRSASKKLSRSHNRLAYAIGDPCDLRFLTGIMPAYSGVIRPPVPIVSGHPYRFDPAGDSGASGHPHFDTV